MKKKTVLITGGTRGIGLAIREKLNKENYNVLYTGTQKKKIKNFIQLDLNSKSSIDEFINKIERTNIDVLVINSGINIIKNFLNFTTFEMARLININFSNNLGILQFILKKMIKRKYGRIVLISSIWGEKPAKKRSIYSLTKKSLQFLCRSIASEYGHNNILINSVSPGFIETELTKKSLDAKKMKRLKKRVPLRRFGKPSEVADLVHYLVDKNSYINGQNIVIDGGYTAV